MIKFIGCEKIKPHKEIIEIITEGKCIDLHNACEFVEFKFNVPKRELSLFWEGKGDRRVDALLQKFLGNLYVD